MRPSRENQVGSFFRNHDDGCVRVCTNDVRHDRCVDDAKAVHAAYAQRGSTTAAASLPILHVPLTCQNVSPTDIPSDCDGETRSKEENRTCTRDSRRNGPWDRESDDTFYPVNGR